MATRRTNKAAATEITSSECNASLRVTPEQRNSLKTIAAMKNQSVFTTTNLALQSYIDAEMPAALKSIEASITRKGVKK